MKGFLDFLLGSTADAKVTKLKKKLEIKAYE